jgi:hypothetical protein
MPTELKVAHEHKSLNVFKVNIGYPLMYRDARGFNRRVILHSFGESAHSAYPGTGTNALLPVTTLA